MTKASFISALLKVDASRFRAAWEQVSKCLPVGTFRLLEWRYCWAGTWWKPWTWLRRGWIVYTFEYEPGGHKNDR